MSSFHSKTHDAYFNVGVALVAAQQRATRTTFWAIFNPKITTASQKTPILLFVHLNPLVDSVKRWKRAAPTTATRVSPARTPREAIRNTILINHQLKEKTIG